MCDHRRTDVISRDHVEYIRYHHSSRTASVLADKLAWPTAHASKLSAFRTIVITRLSLESITELLESLHFNDDDADDNA